MPSSEVEILTTTETLEENGDVENNDGGEKETSPPSPKNGTSTENGNATENDDHSPSPSKKPCTSGPQGSEVENLNNDDSSDEFDMGSYIRVRTRDDGIFEDDDDDDDFDYDFPIPEVEMQEIKPTTRKRKQEIMLREGEAEIIDLEDEEAVRALGGREPTYTIDPEIFGTRRRDRMPLYLLNPDDYLHDPKKQMQIRRAIITYRHHQDKKEQIIKLTEENRRLRESLELIKNKAIELSKCGCERNQTTDLRVLDIKVPVVPPRMYVRGNRPVLAVPYNKCAITPEAFSRMSADNLKPELIKSTSSGVTPSSPSIVSMGTSRMIQLASHSPRPINISSVASGSANQPTRVLSNGRVHTIQTAPGGPPPLRPLRFLQPAVSQPLIRPIQIQTSDPLGTVIKSEPGICATVSKINVINPSTIPMTATVKVEGDANNSPSNRIIFAKRPITATTSTTSTVPTASQLLFGSQFTVTPAAVKIEPTTPAPPLTMSQMAFANRIRNQNPTNLQPPKLIPQPVTSNLLQHPLPNRVIIQQQQMTNIGAQQPIANKLMQQMPNIGAQQPIANKVMQQMPNIGAQQPIANKVLQQMPNIGAQQPIANKTLQQPQGNKFLQQPSTGQIYRTAGGQILRLVQNPGVAVINKPKVTGFQPILPKIMLNSNRPPAPVVQNYTTKKIDLSIANANDLWKKYEDDDDDELAIIAAINDTTPLPPSPVATPPSRNRKQSMAQRVVPPPSPALSKVIPKPSLPPTPKALEEKLELNKYADIVFEEAD
ncbi:unnamed protein product [Orchesella dallaii]|uniref:Uncharacterized protein n=1 Tax=Orchesella dallaii TaxID=48710 RepID=A0ABP1Q0Q6_9HEXA